MKKINLFPFSLLYEVSGGEGGSNEEAEMARSRFNKKIRKPESNNVKVMILSQHTYPI